MAQRALANPRAARLSGERRAIEARRERQAEHDARMAAVRRESAGWVHGDPVDEDVDGYDDVAEYDELDEVEMSLLPEEERDDREAAVEEKGKVKVPLTPKDKRAMAFLVLLCASPPSPRR